MSKARRYFFMAALVVAGEAIFGLPFLVARLFRPTVLDVLQITNLQFGTAFAAYGVVAMLAYFPGGPLADRFPARRLMVAALISTAVGGIYYGTWPGLLGLQLLFSFWGLTTILLFWAAMIRATREWGGDDSQGAAYGLLEGGRGLLAAVLASITVAVFAAFMPDDPATATLAERTTALTQVVWVFAGVAVAAALLVWFAVPESTGTADGTSPPERPHIDLAMIRPVLRNKSVWLQGMIIVCAYVAYKGMDDIGLYARDAFGMDDVAAANLGKFQFWVRPFAALAAGLIADRIGASRASVICFGGACAGNLFMGLGLIHPSMVWVLFVAVAGTGAMVYGLRGVYFALFGEAAVPPALTGTAAGLVSVIGYTPDIFMGPVMGYMTDAHPGATGHEHFFLFLAVFSAAGMVMTMAFQRTSRAAAAAA